jgi:hypothetical protein
VAHSVSISVEARLGDRNRVTTAFRPILAIPHAILSGPMYWSNRSWGFGLLGAAAYVLAVVSWFTLLVKGEQIKGIREFCLYYLRWRTRALAYMALFRDEYPPFGDAPYPATVRIEEPPAMRDRRAIALRLLFAVPHVLVVALLLIAWFVTTAIAWVAILFTHSYPSSLYAFGISVMQWTLRVEAYLLLLVDDYPPFQLE